NWVFIVWVRRADGVAIIVVFSKDEFVEVVADRKSSIIFPHQGVARGGCERKETMREWSNNIRRKGCPIGLGSVERKAVNNSSRAKVGQVVLNGLRNVA